MSRALQALWAGALFSALVACGERFEAAPDAGAGTGGRSGAGGGSGTGGMAGSGGVVGVGGVVGLGGNVGLGGVTGGDFPATSILDNFSRPDGDVGDTWIGAVSDFEIERQQLTDRQGAGSAVFWAERFGPAQEVFATVNRFDPGASEVNLVLKAQEDPSCEYIEVVYQPIEETVEIHHCTGGAWTEAGGAPVVMTPGDVLGARISGAGLIEVFQNGARFLVLDVSAYPHQSGGYIGVNSLDPSAAWDDFGGG